LSRSLEMTGALLLALLPCALLSGCGGAAGNSSLPPGVVAIWGVPGCIDGAFVQPRVIDCLPDGAVFVIDRSGRVQFLDAAGKFLGKFTLKNIEKGYPTGAAVTPDGRVWIAETHAYRVGVYTRDGAELFAIGARGEGDGQFIYPTDVAVSPAGGIYVSDYGGPDRVQEFDPAGRFLRSYGVEGTEPGQFRRPMSVVVAKDGNWFVADSCNDRIQKFSPGGQCIGVFGKTGSADGELRYPYDLAIAPDGTIYIAEYGNSRVQRMTQDGKFLGTWGRLGSGPDELVHPWALAIDANNRLFILDTGNSRVVVLDPALARWSSPAKGQASA